MKLNDPFVMGGGGGWAVRDGLLLLSHWPGSDCEGVAAVAADKIVGYRVDWERPQIYVLTVNGGVWTLDFKSASDEEPDGGVEVVACYEAIEQLIGVQT